MLANIYLRYVFDLRVHRRRRTKALGDVIIVRYADDIGPADRLAAPTANWNRRISGRDHI
jgi:hypothetical protein